MIGLRAGDRVVVHSSLRAVGLDADELIDDAGRGGRTSWAGDGADVHLRQRDLRPGHAGSHRRARRGPPAPARSDALGPPDLLRRGDRERGCRAARRPRARRRDRRRQPTRPARRGRRLRAPARCRPHGEHDRARGRVPRRRVLSRHPVRPVLADARRRPLPRLQPRVRRARAAVARARLRSATGRSAMRSPSS